GRDQDVGVTGTLVLDPRARRRRQRRDVAGRAAASARGGASGALVAAAAASCGTERKRCYEQPQSGEPAPFLRNQAVPPPPSLGMTGLRPLFRGRAVGLSAFAVVEVSGWWRTAANLICGLYNCRHPSHLGLSPRPAPGGEPA